MIYNIYNLRDFDTALNESTNGDIIDGEGITIDLKYFRYSIRKNLEFRNINFDKIWSNSKSNNFTAFTIQRKAGLILEKCEFTPYYTTPSNVKSEVVGFIKAEKASYIEADHCIFNKANYMGIHLYDCPHALITNAEFNYDSPDNGYGYGIWQGGKGNTIDQQLRVFDSKFRKTRHAVAGHYNSNHIHMERCEFWDNVQQVLDRHAGHPDDPKAWGIGGGNYRVIDCTFHDKDTGPIDVQVPLNNKIITAIGNKFNRPNGKCLKLDAMIDGVETTLNETSGHPQVQWGDNYYSN